MELSLSIQPGRMRQSGPLMLSGPDGPPEPTWPPAGALGLARG
jgi:hypothetical protein